MPSLIKQSCRLAEAAVCLLNSSGRTSGRPGGAGVVCMTCQHFTYDVDRHFHKMVGCNLRQKQCDRVST